MIQVVYIIPRSSQLNTTIFKRMIWLMLKLPDPSFFYIVWPPGSILKNLLVRIPAAILLTTIFLRNLPVITWLHYTAVWRRIIRFMLFNGKLRLTLFWYKGRLWSKNFKSKPYPIFEFWFRAIKTDFLPLLCVRARNIHSVHASLAPQWRLKSKNSKSRPHPKFKFWSNIIWLASKGVLILTHWSATRWNHEISPNYKNFSKVHHIHASKQFPRTVRPKQSHYELRLKLPTNHATLRLGIVALITRTSWDRGYALSQG